MPAGCQPSGRSGGHPAQYVEPVRAAVEGRPRLVRPRLGREEANLRRRHVGHVGGQDRDPAAQPGGQCLEQVTLVDAAAGKVLPGAADRGRVDVGGVHLGPFHGGGQGRADRARAAAQVDNHGTRPGHGFPGGSGGVVPPEQQSSLLDEELGTPPRHEHTRRHGDPQAAEPGPAENLLQRQAGGALADHDVEFGRCPGGSDEEPRLVLGEHAAGRAQPGDDNGIRHSYPGHIP